jgi:hypothetical protein
MAKLLSIDRKRLGNRILTGEAQRFQSIAHVGQAFQPDVTAMHDHGQTSG